MAIIDRYKQFYKDNRDKRYLFFKGSARSAKTFSICQIMSVIAMTGKYRIFFISPDFPRISDLANTFAEATGIIPKGSRDGRFAKIGQSTIWFRAFDDYAKAKGKECDYLFVNECNEIDFLIIKRLLAGLKTQALFDYNPTSFFWKNDEIFSKELTAELSTTFRDNPYLPQSLIDQYEREIEIANLETATPMQVWWAKVMCLGEDSDVSGRCFTRVVNINFETYESIQLDEFFATDWGGLDANADPDVIIGIKIDKENKKIYTHEYYYSNNGSNDDIANIIRCYCEQKNLVFETATGGENRIKNILKLSGVRVNVYPAIKGAGSVMSGIRELQEYDIFISGSNFQNEARNYVFEFNGNIIAPKDKFNHCFDALRYGFQFSKVKK